MVLHRVLMMDQLLNHSISQPQVLGLLQVLIHIVIMPLLYLLQAVVMQLQQLAKVVIQSLQLKGVHSL